MTHKPFVLKLITTLTSVNTIKSLLMKRCYNILLITALAILSSFILKPKLKPTLFLIGDSTVKNGTKGQGDGGLWGWGAFIWNMVDTNKIAVQNRALGGTSSGSYAALGLWDKVLADMKPGDIVLMQFGHNDSEGNSIRNNSDTTKEVIDRRTGQKSIVHSYGWNLRKYISDTKAKGATPVVLSLIPPNIWKDGKVGRATNDFTVWAREAAKQGGASFVDLNKIIADKYDKEGEQNVMGKYFTEKDHTHTIEEGAKLNAACVIEGLKALKKNPIKPYLLKQLPVDFKAMIGNGMSFEKARE
jgi:rhamnogalacturonan acetylesterase